MIINLEHRIIEATCNKCEATKGCAFDRGEGTDQCILMGPPFMNPVEDEGRPDIEVSSRECLASMAAQVTTMLESYRAAERRTAEMIAECQLTMQKIMAMQRIVNMAQLVETIKL